MTELTILTVDDPGLFSRIAGAVAAAGANIVGARITTCHDGTVLDVFFLQDINNQAIEDVSDLARLSKTLEQSLTGAIKLEKLLKDRWWQTPLRVRQMPVSSRVLLSNKISKTHSVIEVNGRDYPGLLHKITQALADLGLKIHTATDSTYGERVVDVFYVKDIFGLQIQNEVRNKTSATGYWKFLLIRMRRCMTGTPERQNKKRCIAWPRILANWQPDCG